MDRSLSATRRLYLSSSRGSSCSSVCQVFADVYRRRNVLLIHRDLDERVPVYAVLRAPRVEESILNSCLSRLSLNLQAYASGIVIPIHPETGESQPGQAHQTKELLYSDTIQGVTSPVLVTHASSVEYTYVFWNVNVHLGKCGTPLMIQKPY